MGEGPDKVCALEVLCICVAQSSSHQIHIRPHLQPMALSIVLVGPVHHLLLCVLDEAVVHVLAAADIQLHN